jgi:hypothetical protein
MVTHISPHASHRTIWLRSGGGRCRQAILASCMALALFSLPSLVWSDDSQKHRLISQQRVQDMKDKVANLREQVQDQKHHHHIGGLEARVAALEAQVANIANRASFDPTALLQAVQSLQSQVNDINNSKLATLNTRVDGLNTAVGDLNTKVDNGVVPDLKKYVSVNTNDMNGVKGPNLVFRGVNVHVQSGAGATADTTSGLGNLVVGYNEQASPDQVRLGAHNLVGGSQNSFSSYGGLVFGVANKVTGTYAAVVSGTNNTASGTSSGILSGETTIASGISSGVVGGKLKSATWQNGTSYQGAANPNAGM